MDMENNAGCPVDGTHQTNHYALQPQITPVEEQLRLQLIQQSRLFYEKAQYHKKQHFFDAKYYYILSKKWFDRWKVYVSYDQIKNEKQPSKFIGCGRLPQLNEDIIVEDNKFTLKFSGQYEHLNVCLKSGLQQQIDYIFLTQQMWQVIRYYGGTEVKRFIIDTTDGQKLQLYFQKIHLIIAFNDFLKDVERERTSKFMQPVFQISNYLKIQQIQEIIRSKIKSIASDKYTTRFSTDMPIRFWLMPFDTRKNILMNSFLQGCKANPSFSYKLFIDGQFMQMQSKLNEYDILPQTIIICQLKQQKQEWVFFNFKKLLQGPCNQCRSVKLLAVLCSCKFAAYCSKQCKYKDKSHHKFRCPNDAESDEQQSELILNEDSRKGVVGLRNLGNTCFMNSGLQCLSNVRQLTQYFISGEYEKDINKENPLGTKGQLSTHYGKLMKNIWYGKQSSVAPTALKRAIGKFQPMFVGYNQHDSGQLITYLLDGLHQDLNQIKVKPYVESKDYDGRPDEIIAKQSWQNFLKRNKSKITDLLYGQYRSIVDCSKCEYRSIQFDPFSMCSLSIMNNSQKRIELKFINQHFYLNKVSIGYEKSWNWKVSDAIKQISKQMSLPDNISLLTYVASYASCEIIDNNRSIDEVRKQFKYRTVYMRELFEGENPQTDVKVMLGNTVCHSYYNDESYRKNLTTYRLYYVSKKMTCKQVHHRLYGYFKKVYPTQNYQDDIIKVQQKQQPMRILLIPASKYSTCAYCKKKACDGCLLPYDDRLFGQVLPEDDDKVQMQLYWRKNQKEVDKLFQDKQSSSDKETKFKSNASTNLQQCFKLSQASETLSEDNAWYCPKCKDFVVASKQMQIYKAPKILALCLKRFKRKEYFQQKYNILVDFPLENFDMSPYIINPDLPQDYFTNQQGKIKPESVIYDLISISNHFGGTGGGHYTAYCKNHFDNQWYDFDDSYVNKVKQAEGVVSQGAYILFYKRRM